MTIAIEEIFSILLYTDAATFSLRKIPINPPTFALLFTITDPTIPKINKTTAPHPKPITLSAPSTSTAKATPPIGPNTNSVVRFILNILDFLYFILIYAFPVTNFLTFFQYI